MNDLSRFALAEQLISTNDLDRARPALHWIFHSKYLEEYGFPQTAKRLGVDPDKYQKDLLQRSAIARSFYYGNNREEHS